MSPSSAKDNAPTWAHALAGQVAGMVGLTVVHPVDTLKIRIQANGGGALATASSIYNREGPLALYKGSLTHYLRLGPHMVLVFGILEQLKSMRARSS